MSWSGCSNPSFPATQGYFIQNRQSIYGSTTLVANSSNKIFSSFGTFLKKSRVMGSWTFESLTLATRMRARLTPWRGFSQVALGLGK